MVFDSKRDDGGIGSPNERKYTKTEVGTPLYDF